MGIGRMEGGGGGSMESFASLSSSYRDVREVRLQRRSFGREERKKGDGRRVINKDAGIHVA